MLHQFTRIFTPQTLQKHAGMRNSARDSAPDSWFGQADSSETESQSAASGNL